MNTVQSQYIKLFYKLSSILKKKFYSYSTYEIEESVQEAICRYLIKNKNSSFDLTESEEKKIYFIARNILRAAISSNRKKVYIDSDDEVNEKIWQLVIGEDIMGRIYIDDIRKYLPEQYIDIFNLITEGYLHKEISKMLGIEYEATKKRWQRCKKWLRDHKAEFYPPD